MVKEPGAGPGFFAGSSARAGEAKRTQTANETRRSSSRLPVPGECAAGCTGSPSGAVDDMLLQSGSDGQVRIQLSSRTARARAPGVTRLHPFLLLALASGSPALGDEGFWLLNDFPSARVQAAHGFGPSQQWLDRVRLGAVRPERLLRQLRVHARPGDDQPSLRPRVRPGPVDCQGRLPRAGVLREDAEGRASLRPHRGLPARVDHRRDRARRGRDGGEGRRGVRDALRQESARIEGACATGPRDAVRGGEPLPRRQVPPLPLPPVPGRAPGLRARVPDGGVRRLRRQLRVPALRLRRRVRPGLRERHSGRDS